MTRGVANPALATAMRELRRSNAARRHVLRERKKSRAAQKYAAVKDSLS